MKKVIGLPVLLLIIFVLQELGTAQNNKAPRIADLFWLLGKWERTNEQNGRYSLEEWSRKDTLSYQGTGLTIQINDTVFKEELSLIKEGNAIFYVAEVAHNPAPVKFKLTSLKGTKAIFENPDHDFPKKITYLLENKKKLKVQIEGDGKRVDFNFKKVR